MACPLLHKGSHNTYEIMTEWWKKRNACCSICSCFQWIQCVALVATIQCWRLRKWRLRWWIRGTVSGIKTGCLRWPRTKKSRQTESKVGQGRVHPERSTEMWGEGTWYKATEPASYFSPCTIHNRPVQEVQMRIKYYLMLHCIIYDLVPRQLTG